jgi:hypothetical protein
MTTRAFDGAGRISFDQRKQERLTAAAQAQLVYIMADPFLPRLLIRDRQTSRVAELRPHAFETVPIYNEIYKKARVTRADFRTLDDLCIFPIITKSDFHARNLNSVRSLPFANECATRDINFPHPQSRTRTSMPVVIYPASERSADGLVPPPS